MTIYRIRVPHKLIQKNPFQVRTEYGDIDELAMRIYGARFTYPDTLGLMQVPQGRIVADDGNLLPIEPLWEELEAGRTLEEFGAYVQLAFGHRRQKAMALLFHNKGCADYIEMPIELRDFTDDEMLDAVWSENKERRDLSEVEEAELMQLAIKETGLTHAKLAQRWNVSRATVSNQLRLLKLPEGIKQANRRGEMSSRLCLALLPVHQLLKKINRLPQPVQKQLKWNKHFPDQDKLPLEYVWEKPFHPNRVLQSVAKNPHLYASTDIRNYMKGVMKNLTQPVPNSIRGEDFGDNPNIASTTCKGCKYLFQSHCIHPTCVDYRKAEWATALAKRVADEYGVTYVENIRDHNLTMSMYETELIELFLDTESDNPLRNQIVVGFYDGDRYVASPFLESSYRPVASYEDIDGKENRNGIAIGLKGDQTAFRDYAKAQRQVSSDVQAQQEEPSAKELMLKEWHSKAMVEAEALQNATIALFKKWLTPVFEEQHDLLILMMSLLGQSVEIDKWRDKETTYLIDELAKNLQHSGLRMWLYYGGESRQMYMKLQTILSNTENLSIDALFPNDSAVDTAKRMAIRSLGYWQQNRRSSYDVDEKCKVALSAVEEATEHIAQQLTTNQDDKELKQLNEWLAIANNEILEILGVKRDDDIDTSNGG